MLPGKDTFLQLVILTMALYNILFTRLVME